VLDQGIDHEKVIVRTDLLYNGYAPEECHDYLMEGALVQCT
jgi:hypothetical protein